MRELVGCEHHSAILPPLNPLGFYNFVIVDGVKKTVKGGCAGSADHP